MEVDFEILDKGMLPAYQSAGASGADLYSTDRYYLPPGEIRIVDTGIKIAIPKGYEAQIRSRSGWAAQKGVMVLNSPGTIDSRGQ